MELLPVVPAAAAVAAFAAAGDDGSLAPADCSLCARSTAFAHLIEGDAGYQGVYEGSTLP